MTRVKHSSGEGASNKLISLFDLRPAHQEPEPGSLNINLMLKESLAQALKSTPVKRREVALRMSEYIGVDVTLYMLDAWTAESKEGYRFPLEYLPGFCAATGSYDIIEKVARACGCRLVKSDEIFLLEEARLDAQIRQLATQKKELQRYREQVGGSRP